jgi:hypothetical protein
MTFPVCCRARARSWRSEPTAERGCSDAATAVTVVTLTRDLAGIVGADHVLPGETAPYGEDSTRDRVGLQPSASPFVDPHEVRIAFQAEVACGAINRGAPALAATVSGRDREPLRPGVRSS